MYSLIAIVLVRTSSTRLPNKCLLPLGEYSVIEHVIYRLNHYGFTPIISTSKAKEDDILESICNKTHTKIFRGDLDNKIKRIVDTAVQFNLENVLLIDADDPFFDAEANKKSFSYLSQGYDLVIPPSDYYCGSVGYSIKRSVLEHSMKVYNTAQSEMLESFILDLNGVAVKHMSAPLTGLDHIRLTLDYQEDYDFITHIVKSCGQFATPDDIMKLLQKNPELIQINSFRQQEWKRNQDLIKKKNSKQKYT